MTDAARADARPHPRDDDGGTFPLAALFWAHVLGAVAGVAAVLVLKGGAWTGLLAAWLVAVVSTPLLCLLPLLVADDRDRAQAEEIEAWQRDLEEDRAGARAIRDAA